MAHRPVHAGHTALDASPLKGGAGGHGAAGEAALAPHGHLPVGADVQKQVLPGLLPQAGGHESRGDIAPHIARHAGQQPDGHAVQFACPLRAKEQAVRPEGRGGHAGHAFAGEQALHHRVPRH